jgi:hypothetical protein
VTCSAQGYDRHDGGGCRLTTTKEHYMSTSPQEPLKDEEIATTGSTRGPADADGTDGADGADGADGTDGTDGGDADGTDGGDADGTDGGDADGTDGGDADGTDA